MVAGARTRAHDTLNVAVPTPSGTLAARDSAGGASVAVGVLVCDGVPVGVRSAVRVPVAVSVGVRDCDAVPEGELVSVPDGDGVTDDDGVTDGVTECVAPVECVAETDGVNDAEADPVIEPDDVAVLDNDVDTVAVSDVLAVPDGVPDCVRVPVGDGVAQMMVLETPMRVYGDGSRTYHLGARRAGSGGASCWSYRGNLGGVADADDAGILVTPQSQAALAPPPHIHPPLPHHRRDRRDRKRVLL